VAHNNCVEWTVHKRTTETHRKCERTIKQTREEKKISHDNCVRSMTMMIENHKNNQKEQNTQQKRRQDNKNNATVMKRRE